MLEDPHDTDISGFRGKLAELRSVVLANLKEAQMRQKKRYDLKHRGPYFPKRSLVLLRNSRRQERKGDKLASCWTGPFELVESLGKGL